MTPRWDGLWDDVDVVMMVTTGKSRYDAGVDAYGANRRLALDRTSSIWFVTVTVRLVLSRVWAVSPGAFSIKRKGADPRGDVLEEREGARALRLFVEAEIPLMQCMR